RKPMKAFIAVTVMMVFAVICASTWIFPYLEPFKSRRPFSLQVKKLVPPETPLYIFADTMNDFNYYTKREVIRVLPSRLELERLLAQSRDGYILIKDRDLKKLNIFAPEKIVASDAVGSTAWNLVDLTGAATR
ncbi:MAG: hypothetical protein ACREO5_06660, partial [Candidatus Binatia bacterium]